MSDPRRTAKGYKVMGLTGKDDRVLGGFGLMWIDSLQRSSESNQRIVTYTGNPLYRNTVVGDQYLELATRLNTTP